MDVVSEIKDESSGSRCFMSEVRQAVKMGKGGTSAMSPYMHE